MQYWRNCKVSGVTQGAGVAMAMLWTQMLTCETSWVRACMRRHLTARFPFRAVVFLKFTSGKRPDVLQAAYLLRNDGLFVGSSAAMNCVGAVKLARKLGPGHTIATILCDGGQRYPLCTTTASGMLC